jgi:hypothetical protein
VNTENSFAAGEIGGQGQAESQVCESSLATTPGSEATTSAAAAAEAPGAPKESEAKAEIAQPAEPSVEAKISSAGEAGGNNRSGVASAIASSDKAADPVGEALAALDRRDYAMAKRLFETLGRKDAAEAIGNALAALDRKDYATAQGLFEALAPPKPAASARGPIASGSPGKTKDKPAMPLLEAVPVADAGYRQPQGKKAKRRLLRPLLFGTALALCAILGASALYGSRGDWSFAAAKSQAIAGLASALDLAKARLAAITGASAREKELSAVRDFGAALVQVTIRLDQIEHDYGARLDKLDERIDQHSASGSADIAAAPASAAVAPTSVPAAPVSETPAAPASVAAPPVSELADVVARLDNLEKRVAVAGAPVSELADLKAKIDRLEKRATVTTAGSVKAVPPAPPKQSALMAKAESSASNEILRPDNQRPLLRDYSVEAVQGGIAVVDGRNGPQEVAPGDFIPGAGRVLRIERRGGAWFVVTSRGVIGRGQPSGPPSEPPAPY